jgi:hypothetical protein
MSGVSVGLRILTVSLLLLSPRLWPWGLDRRSMFFGVRVPVDFAGSEAGRNILRTFRKRLWICTFALAGIYAVAVPSGPMVMFIWFNGAVAATMLIYAPLYGVAHRQTKMEAGPAPEPSVRSAALLPEETHQPRGLAFAAWIVMIVPTALPLITGILLAWNWFRYHIGPRSEWAPSQIAMAACLGILGTAMQYALRYRARASELGRYSRGKPQIPDLPWLNDGRLARGRPRLMQSISDATLPMAGDEDHLVRHGVPGGNCAGRLVFLDAIQACEAVRSSKRRPDG